MSAQRETSVSLRNYFETDFPTMAVVRYELRARSAAAPLSGGVTFHAQAHLDFTSHTKFCSFHIPADSNSCLELCKAALAQVRDVLALRGGANITLPSLRFVQYDLKLVNTDQGLDVVSLPFEGGGYDVCDFQVAPPVYIYSERDLAAEELKALVRFGQRQNVVVRFRGQEYAMKRLERQMPGAFISHDSRDKDAIARPLAVGLSRLGHSVWFDEFALKPGDRLRESFEDGIKQCKRCILVLTPNFLKNRGWAAAEFRSIFTREIIEEKGLMIPVWCGVTKEDVYEYCPSLINVAAALWSETEQEKCILGVARVLEDPAWV